MVPRVKHHTIFLKVNCDLLGLVEMDTSFTEIEFAQASYNCYSTEWVGCNPRPERCDIEISSAVWCDSLTRRSRSSLLSGSGTNVPGRSQRRGVARSRAR
jgi:hypothetical protein